MSLNLENFKLNLKKQIFGKETEKNQEKGLCIQCKQPALKNCYSEAGRKEFKISGLCEKCYDKMFE